MPKKCTKYSCFLSDISSLINIWLFHRSPGGTPLRPDKPKSENQDPASLIAMALKKKFANHILHSPRSPCSPDTDQENEYASPDSPIAPVSCFFVKVIVSIIFVFIYFSLTYVQYYIQTSTCWYMNAPLPVDIWLPSHDVWLVFFVGNLYIKSQDKKKQLYKQSSNNSAYSA